MAASRYTKSPVIGFSSQYGTFYGVQVIRRAVKSGAIPVQQRVLHDTERLDTLAGQLYGDGRYWWVLAAASDIGWGMQVPPGTIINVPRLADVLRIVA